MVFALSVDNVRNKSCFFEYLISKRKKENSEQTQMTVISYWLKVRQNHMVQHSVFVRSIVKYLANILFYLRSICFVSSYLSLNLFETHTTISTILKVSYNQPF